MRQTYKDIMNPEQQRQHEAQLQAVREAVAASAVRQREAHEQDDDESPEELEDSDESDGSQRRMEQIHEHHLAQRQEREWCETAVDWLETH